MPEAGVRSRACTRELKRHTSGLRRRRAASCATRNEVNVAARPRGSGVRGVCAYRRRVRARVRAEVFTRVLKHVAFCALA